MINRIYHAAPVLGQIKKYVCVQVKCENKDMVGTHIFFNYFFSGKKIFFYAF